MKEKSLKELKEELKWLEETSIFTGKDGMPSVALILFALITGILPGIIILLIYRSVQKDKLRKKITELKKGNSTDKFEYGKQEEEEEEEE